MKKIVYIASQHRMGRCEEEWYHGYYFSIEEARKTAEHHKYYKELEKDRVPNIFSVQGYEVESDSLDPEEAFNEFMDDLAWLPDPVYYEELN